VTQVVEPLRPNPSSLHQPGERLGYLLGGEVGAILTSEHPAAMAAAAPAGVMLIAAGHLDRHAVVIVAPPLHLSITTVSGTAASTVEENLGPVPGGASADDWVIHLPTPDPLGDVVRSVAKGSARLSTEPPPDDAAKSASQVEGDLIDLEALAKRRPEG